MKLTSNNKARIETTIDFICSLVFKDEAKANANETQESAEQASRYISAFLKTDDLSEADREVVLKSYKELNPYYKELQTKYRIEPFTARLARDFDIIYQPEGLIQSNQFLYHYRTIYKNCLQAFYVTSYSPAMVHKDQYREMCLLHINLMSFINLLAKWLESPFDIDLMTETEIDRFMYSFGITFFRNLPFRYKTILAKNLNKLIINKGTDKVIIDILDLFGFSNIDVHKYYLVRDAILEHKDLEKDTSYLESSSTDVFFLSHNIKIPSLNIAIKKGEYKKHDYGRVIVADDYWYLEKDEIRSLNFDFVESKYFSIETGFDISTEIMNTSYIFNLLRWIRGTHPDKEDFSITSNLISSSNPARIEDIIIALQILVCDYQGVVDTISYDEVGIKKVYEFSKYDPLGMNEKIIAETGYNNDLSMYDTRNVGIYDSESIYGIFSKNMNTWEEIDGLLTKEVDYQKFKKLKAAREAKFIQKLNYDLYEGKTTLTSYLKSKNLDLYNIINDIRSIIDDDEQKRVIETTISSFTDILTTALKKYDIYVGSTSLSILIDYIKKVILTFKSFTVSLVDLAFFMVIKERNDYRLFDYYTMNAYFDLEDAFELHDVMYKVSHFDLEDRIPLNEILTFFIFFVLVDRFLLRDDLLITSKFDVDSMLYIADTTVQTTLMNAESKMKLQDFSDILIRLEEFDRITLRDFMEYSNFYKIDADFRLREELFTNSIGNDFSSRINLRDPVVTLSKDIMDSRFNPRDDYAVTLSLGDMIKDNFFLRDTCIPKNLIEDDSRIELRDRNDIRQVRFRIDEMRLDSKKKKIPLIKNEAVRMRNKERTVLGSELYIADTLTENVKLEIREDSLGNKEGLNVSDKIKITAKDYP